jgi:hypothetical protein
MRYSASNVVFHDKHGLGRVQRDAESKLRLTSTTTSSAEYRWERLTIRVLFRSYLCTLLAWWRNITACSQREIAESTASLFSGISLRRDHLRVSTLCALGTSRIFNLKSMYIVCRRFIQPCQPATLALFSMSTLRAFLADDTRPHAKLRLHRLLER